MHNLDRRPFRKPPVAVTVDQLRVPTVRVRADHRVSHGGAERLADSHRDAATSSRAAGSLTASTVATFDSLSSSLAPEYAFT